MDLVTFRKRLCQALRVDLRTCVVPHWVAVNNLEYFHSTLGCTWYRFHLDMTTRSRGECALSRRGRETAPCSIRRLGVRVCFERPVNIIWNTRLKQARQFSFTNIKIPPIRRAVSVKCCTSSGSIDLPNTFFSRYDSHFLSTWYPPSL